MKKFLLFIFTLVFSLIAYADETKCRVDGTDNIVKLNQTQKTASAQKLTNGKTATPVIFIQVSLEKPAEKDISVVVRIKDRSGNIIGTKVLRIDKGRTASNHDLSFYSSRMVHGQTYYLSIAGASITGSF